MCSDIFERVMVFSPEERRELIKKCKDFLCSGHDHYTNLEVILLRTIHAMQQELDMMPVFQGEKEPDDWVITLLQSDRDELKKWIGRCAWHCKKVHELSKENAELKELLTGEETCNGCEKVYNPKISGGIVNGHPFCSECMEGMAAESATFCVENEELRALVPSMQAALDSAMEDLKNIKNRIADLQKEEK